MSLGRKGGKKIKAINSSTGHSDPVTSSTGFNKGRHCWKIRVNGAYHGCYDKCFGVVTKPDFQKTSGGGHDYLWNASAGLSYFFNRERTQLEYAENGSRTPTVKNLAFKRDAPFTVAIALDCEGWKISFWVDDKKLGSIEMRNNQTYYPAVIACGHTPHGADYDLIVG